MKWAIVAACLTCSDPEPFPVVILEDVDSSTCRILAALTLKHALPSMELGTVAASWCVPLSDWSDDEPYPQVKR